MHHYILFIRIGSQMERLIPLWEDRRLELLVDYSPVAVKYNEIFSTSTHRAYVFPLRGWTPTESVSTLVNQRALLQEAYTDVLLDVPGRKKSVQSYTDDWAAIQAFASATPEILVNKQPTLTGHSIEHINETYSKWWSENSVGDCWHMVAVCR